MLAEWEASNLYVCPKSRAWVANEAGSRHVAVSGASSTTPDSSQPPPALKLACRAALGSATAWAGRGAAPARG